MPVRTCVVCREQSTKRQLLRIVRQPDGSVMIDETGRKNGRGAYLCDRSACWHRAAEADMLGRSLNTTITDELRTMLRERAQALISADAESPKEKARVTDGE